MQRDWSTDGWRGPVKRMVILRDRTEVEGGGASGSYIIRPLRIRVGRCERTLRGSARLLWKKQTVSNPSVEESFCVCLQSPRNLLRAAAALDRSFPASPRPCPRSGTGFVGANIYNTNPTIERCLSALRLRSYTALSP